MYFFYFPGSKIFILHYDALQIYILYLIWLFYVFHATSVSSDLSR